MQRVIALKTIDGIVAARTGHAIIGIIGKDSAKAAEVILCQRCCINMLQHQRAFIAKIDNGVAVAVIAHHTLKRGKIGHSQTRQINNVRTGFKIGNGILAKTFGQLDVVNTGSAGQGIVARTACQGVNAIPARQNVIAVITGQVIIKRRPFNIFHHLNNVIARPAGSSFMGQVNPHPGNGIAIIGYIRAFAALQLVIAQAAAQIIVSGTTLHNVVANATDQAVIARTTLHNVVASTAIKHIVAIAALQHIIACIARQAIIPGTPLQNVIARAAIKHIVPVATLQGIITSTTRQRIHPGRAMHNVTAHRWHIVTYLGVVGFVCPVAGFTGASLPGSAIATARIIPR